MLQQHRHHSKNLGILAEYLSGLSGGRTGINLPPIWFRPSHVRRGGRRRQNNPLNGGFP